MQDQNIKAKNAITDALLGVAIGDAVGVPFEFSSKEQMRDNPATGMTGYGTYNQPPGTWSDDSSMTFCLAESLLNGYDLADISRNFIRWRNEACWTAHNELFDIGITTSHAITRLQQIIEEDQTKELKNLKFYSEERDNGNGSLMRILPLLFYIKGKPISEQFEIVWEVSSLTHRHIRAAMSCLIYLKLAENILDGMNKETAYKLMRDQILSFWDEIDFDMDERKHFQKLILADIRETSIDELKTGGYVIEVLESSIWFFLNRESYEETILSIINLGHDTDTSAAIVGGLAGIYYGRNSIPEEWQHSLARYDDIVELGDKLTNVYF
jgi:ADP-ribosyl-[dinitrogen reductase] hydrolase